MDSHYSNEVMVDIIHDRSLESMQDYIVVFGGIDEGVANLQALSLRNRGLLSYN
jgi:hypothetical protein